MHIQLKLSIICKDKLNYWHNFRNIGALLVAYYATFSSTISKPKGKGNYERRRGEGRRRFKNEAISEGVGVAFRGVFPEALGKIGELLKATAALLSKLSVISDHLLFMDS